MGKIYMTELADMLAQRAGISKRDAQQFISAFIETIQDGVTGDKLVKIKGLGTFKVIDVDARESVNVNTGERVTIDSHQKLSFTPDAAMKELVNKPFSQFETVVLNEGVEFDEEPEVEEPAITEDETPVPIVENKTSEPEVEQKQEEATPVIETVVDSPAPEVEQKVEEPAPAIETIVESSAPEVEQKAEVVVPKVEEKKAAPVVAEEKEIPVVEESSEDEKKAHSYWWMWLLLAIIACVISFAGGYLFGRHVDHQSSQDEENPVDTTTQVAPVAVKDTLKTDTISKDTLKIDTVQAKPVVEEVPEVEPEWKKYEKMDVRVRTGAYGIVGLDRMEKVRPGDTTKRIARRTLGEGMECYIEVYNNITTSDLKEGQSIKIPKLEWKKNLRKQNKK